MCLLFLLALAIYTLVAVFFESARVLLPWTISATIIASLIGLGLGKRFGASWAAQRAAGCIATFLLTIGLGYLGFLLIPPRVRPPIPPKPILEALQIALTELPNPNISHDDLWTMLPIHLVISGVIGVLFVSAIMSGRWA